MRTFARSQARAHHEVQFFCCHGRRSDSYLLRGNARSLFFAAQEKSSLSIAFSAHFWRRSEVVTIKGRRQIDL
jgi:hypothetical protein